MELPLLKEHILFLLETFRENIHLAIDALAFRFHLNKITSVPNLSFLQEILKDLIAKEKEIMLTPDKIIKKIAEHFGIRSSDILGRAQTKDFTLPRQIAMHLCRTKLNMPFIKIGEFFGRDHSTVMTSVKQIQKAIDTKDKNIFYAVSEIARNL